MITRIAITEPNTKACITIEALIDVLGKHAQLGGGRLVCMDERNECLLVIERSDDPRTGAVVGQVLFG